MGLLRGPTLLGAPFPSRSQPLIGGMVLAANMPRTCSIQLLGGFLVTVDGDTVAADAWRHRRGADLVKLLALAPGHTLHREEVMAALWPDLDAEAAAANLRKAIHYARRALGGFHAIAAGPALLELWPGGSLAVDVVRFEAAAGEALTSGRGTEAAAELCSGDLLPAERYAEWTEPRREHLRFLCLELWRAASRWERVLDVDRSNEEAHRALMQKYLLAGDRQAAIRQFQRLREVLRADLGVGPDEETVALFEKAIALAGPEPPTLAERAQALIARGLVAWNGRELQQAQRLAENARQLAVENHLVRELGEASTLLGLVAFAEGRWMERFRTEFGDALHGTPEETAFRPRSYSTHTSAWPMRCSAAQTVLLWRRSPAIFWARPSKRARRTVRRWATS